MGSGSHQPVVHVLVDPYTLMYQFHHFCYYSELQGCCGQTKGQCFNLVCLTLDMKSQVFPGLFLYRDMEVGVLEIYLGYPLPLLEGCSYCFRCLHFEFLRLKEKIQFAQI